MLKITKPGRTDYLDDNYNVELVTLVYEGLQVGKRLLFKSKPHWDSICTIGKNMTIEMGIDGCFSNFKSEVFAIDFHNSLLKDILDYLSSFGLEIQENRSILTGKLGTPNLIIFGNEDDICFKPKEVDSLDSFINYFNKIVQHSNLYFNFVSKSSEVFGRYYAEVGPMYTPEEYAEVTYKEAQELIFSILPGETSFEELEYSPDYMVINVSYLRDDQYYHESTHKQRSIQALKESCLDFEKSTGIRVVFEELGKGWWGFCFR